MLGQNGPGESLPRARWRARVSRIREAGLDGTTASAWETLRLSLIYHHGSCNHSKTRGLSVILVAGVVPTCRVPCVVRSCESGWSDAAFRATECGKKVSRTPAVSSPAAPAFHHRSTSQCGQSGASLPTINMGRRRPAGVTALFTPGRSFSLAHRAPPAPGSWANRPPARTSGRLQAPSLAAVIGQTCRECIPQAHPAAAFHTAAGSEGRGAATRGTDGQREARSRMFLFFGPMSGRLTLLCVPFTVARPSGSLGWRGEKRKALTPPPFSIPA